jgi:enoyl-CoA hydratase/carnithine racemase
MAEMEYQDILFAVTGRVALLTLNQPQIRNPMGGKRTTEELVHALTRTQEDEGISALVITGAGSAFSAGGNLRELRDRAHDASLTPIKIMEFYRRATHRMTRALANLDVPTIAAVNGLALGGGMDLATMCDIRLASTEAFFGETFLNLGSIPGTGGSWFLEQAVGHMHAMRMTAMAEPIGAEEALAIGLVARVLPPDQLLPEAMALAQRGQAAAHAAAGQAAAAAVPVDEHGRLSGHLRRGPGAGPDQRRPQGGRQRLLREAGPGLRRQLTHPTHAHESSRHARTGGLSR